MKDHGISARKILKKKIKIISLSVCMHNRFLVVLFKYIYFTSIEKQVLTTHTNLSRCCFLGTTPVLAPNVWANENPKAGATRDLMIERPTLFPTTTDSFYLVVCQAS